MPFACCMWSLSFPETGIDLQKQLAGMLSAERDLQKHLHAAHEQIELQMQTIREEVRLSSLHE